MSIKTRRSGPVVNMDGSVELSIGIVLEAQTAGIFILSNTAARCGFKDGDYVEIDSDARSTRIVRRIYLCSQRHSAMKTAYAYLDEESARYLATPPHEKVILRHAGLDMELP